MNLKDELITLVNKHQEKEMLVDKLADNVFELIKKECLSSAQIGKRVCFVDLSFEGCNGGNTHLNDDVVTKVLRRLDLQYVAASFTKHLGDNGKFTMTW